jgi:hypothetical protein
MVARMQKGVAKPHRNPGVEHLPPTSYCHGTYWQVILLSQMGVKSFAKTPANRIRLSHISRPFCGPGCGSFWRKSALKSKSTLSTLGSDGCIPIRFIPKHTSRQFPGARRADLWKVVFHKNIQRAFNVS